MIYLPLIGALARGAGTILERVVLKGKKINIKLYQTASFFSIILIMLPFIYFFWKMTPPAFELQNILIFVLVILFSIIANLFTFYSLKWEKVSKIEPARILEPLFTILLAIIFSFFIGETLYQRNSNVLFPALVAGLALILSHIKKDHLKFSKYFLAAIAGSFFFALELVVSKLILNFYSPMSFYFIRCLFVFLISILIFKPQFNKLNKKTSIIIFFTAIIWVIYRVIVYYGYLQIGIIFTTLMIMLGPIFVYLFAKIFLKEKLRLKNILSAIVIVLCILYAILS